MLKQQKIYPLTTVRFFAAFSVMVNHSLFVFLPWLHETSKSYGGGEYLKELVASFSFSVSFFFLLSGYVLAHVYLRDGMGVPKRRFFVARFARIYPLYLATLLMDTPRALLEKAHRLGWEAAILKMSGLLVAYLMMVQAWYVQRLRGIDGPNASISAEVFFYLCFPLLGVWLWKLKGMRLWCAGIGLYVFGQMMVLGVRRIPFILIPFPPLHLTTFALGIVLARWQALRQSETAEAWVPAWKIYGVLGICLAAALLSGAAAYRFAVIDLFYSGLLAPVFLGTIWALSCRPSLVSRLLSARWLVVLGDASYALYLLHEPLMHLFRHFCRQQGATGYLAYLTLCLGLSVLVFIYFEMPLRSCLFERLHTRSLESTEEAATAQ